MRTQDPAIEAAEIVPLDRIQVPAADDLPPLRTAGARRPWTKRPDVLGFAISATRPPRSRMAGTAESPCCAHAFRPPAQTYNRGVAEPRRRSSTVSARTRYFIGGYGTALGQIFRRDFPNYSAGVSFAVPLGNRTAQGDYGIDQLQFRQSQVTSQRDINNIVVDISARMSAVRQARARYSAAREHPAPHLQEQLLAADRTKFCLRHRHLQRHHQRPARPGDRPNLRGQRHLRTPYAHARLSLDQTLGETLERNGVSLEEGLMGKVNREKPCPGRDRGEEGVSSACRRPHPAC